MSNEKNLEQPERFVLEGYLTEGEVLDLFAISKATLSNLRYNKALPFIETAKTSRLYPEKELRQWLDSRIRVLNKASMGDKTTENES